MTEHCDSHHDDAGSTTSEDGTDFSCGNCLSHSYVLALDVTLAPGCDLSLHTFFSKNDSAPDAPVSEIDLPPQLS